MPNKWTKKWKFQDHLPRDGILTNLPQTLWQMTEINEKYITPRKAFNKDSSHMSQ
jgi:hypothetical protein